MSKPLFSGDEIRFRGRNMQKNKIVLIALTILVIGSVLRLLGTQPVFYAHACATSGSFEKSVSLQSKLWADDAQMSENKIVADIFEVKMQDKDSSQFVQKIYAIVGDAPIKAMVPFISKRDEKVAAFLVGIAKKESSLGVHSPSLNGQDCYNYWGYKGAGSRGFGMGYGCFASPEEAVKIVGDRIAELVAKDRNTPDKMVHTWKCGTNCKGDPGAPGWVATVAMYFTKVIG